MRTLDQLAIAVAPVAAALAVATSLSLAWAGGHGDPPVRIDLVNRRASGGLDNARLSGDSNQFIGCEVNTSKALSYVFCFAQDADGQYASCYDTTGRLVPVARSIRSDSRIS